MAASVARRKSSATQQSTNGRQALTTRKTHAEQSPGIRSLTELTHRYDVIFCDIWGVVHDGVKPFARAGLALAAARAKGLSVILVTNSPRPNDSVAAQLAEIGVARDSWDAIVTSGDATRKLIAQGPRRLFHIGPDRELNLYDGLGIELVSEAMAEGVCCTGLFDDAVETPDDYAPLLARLRARDLPFICANPDIVVHRGATLAWCAGALARDFAGLGGQTFIAGKPHRPIYDAALEIAGTLAGRPVDPARILAIGDGMPTDIKGAHDFGLDVLFITHGIHRDQYVIDGRLDRERLNAFVAATGYIPVADMPHLA
jgi:HAD superfamily hydrolase (TIGR01459 family)